MSHVGRNNKKKLYHFLHQNSVKIIANALISDIIFRSKRKIANGLKTRIFIYEKFDLYWIYDFGNIKFVNVKVRREIKN